MLKNINRIIIEWSPADLKGSITARFEKIVDQCRDEVALRGSHRSLTYGQLNQLVNQVAREVLRHQRDQKAPVALIYNHDVNSIIAILAVLKVGKIYTYLDPLLPEARLRDILDQLKPGLCLTDTHNLAKASSLIDTGCPLVNSDQIDPTIPDQNREASWGSELIAAVFFTSGSTGKPKGVKRSHLSILYRAYWDAQQVQISTQDTCSLVMSCSFGSSTADIFKALLSGATLSLFDLRAEGISRLAGWIQQEQVTLLHVPIEFLRQWLDLRPVADALTTVRHLLPSGRLFRSDLDLFYQYFPRECLIRSQFSSTETGLMTCMNIDQSMEFKRSILPVGYLVEGNTIQLVDEDDHPVGPDQIGEIVVTSPFLSPGYWENPQLTQQKFKHKSDQHSIRTYYTGDLGRWREDGCLELVGRKDSMVKIRGYRIELSEVEAALLSLEIIRQATVVVAASVQEPYLIAYVVPKTGVEITVSQLRRELSQTLPDYMIPTACLSLDQLPLTANGKVNHKLLPEPTSTRPPQDSPYIPPASDLHAQLATLWSEILSVSPVGIEDHFLDLGGNSLLAMRLAARVTDQFDVLVRPQDIFGFPSISQLTPLIETKSDRNQSTQRVLRLSQRESFGSAYPVSYAQWRWWLLQQSKPSHPGFNMPNLLRIEEPLHQEALRTALLSLFHRHEILRTTYSEVDGKLQQIVHTQFQLPFSQVNLETLDHLEQVLDDLISQSFDLSQDLPCRATLILSPQPPGYLLWISHHIASDHESTRLLLRELASHYRSLCQGRSLPEQPPTLHYSDFALWQRGFWSEVRIQELLDNYLQELGSDLPLLDLPLDRPRPGQLSGKGERIRFTLSSTQLQKIHRLNQQEKVTMAMTILAVFSVVMGIYSRQDHFLLACPISERQTPETQGMVGCLQNTFLIRIDLNSKLTFRHLLGQIKQKMLKAYDLGQIPIQMLLERLILDHAISPSSLFRVLVNSIEDLPGNREELAPFTTIPLQTSPTLHEWVLNSRTEAGSHSLELTYSPDLFEQSTLQGMIKRLEIVFDTLICHPDQAIEDLYFLNPQELKRLLVEWNDTATAYRRDQTIPSLFEAQVKATPEALALSYPDQQLTYQQLNWEANRLAHQLRDRGVAPGTPVGLYLDRSAQMVIALLAILKLGGVYVPLDSASPPERIHAIIRNANLSLILVASTPFKFPFPPETPDYSLTLLDLSSQLSSPDPIQGLNRDLPLDPENPAYINYTSGSTGEPKGVVIPHRGVIRLVTQTNYINIQPGDRIGQAATIAFDAATFEIWGALLNGATVVGIPKETLLDPLRLKTMLRQERISILFLTTALVHYYGRECPDLFANLKYLLFGGEAVDPRWIKEILEKGPPQQLLHVYGPTENTTFSTWHPITCVSDNAMTLPIGKPIANTTCYVLDHRLQPVPIGVSGELYLGGEGLALSYLGRPKLTSETFIQNPFSPDPNSKLYKTGDLVRHLPNGDLEFLGRIDDQVKIRGFRIELGEIESILSQHFQVKQAVVLLQDMAGEKDLIAYLVLNPNNQATLKSVFTHLQERLPAYMIPSKVVLSDSSFPLSTVGKIDRRALARISTQHQQPWLTADLSDSPPQDQLEERLLQIWSQVLGLKQIDLTVSFFDLGGHSLLAIKLLAALEQTLQIKVPLQVFFETLTIKRLAHYLRQQQPSPADHQLRQPLPHLPELTADSYRSLLASTAGFSGKRIGPRHLLVQSHGGKGIPLVWTGPYEVVQAMGSCQRPVYVLPQGKEVYIDSPGTYIRALAALYVEELLSLDPEGTFFLGGYCFSGRVTYEIAQQLHARGYSTPLILFVNMPAIDRHYRRMARWQSMTTGRVNRLLKQGLEWNALQTKLARVLSFTHQVKVENLEVNSIEIQMEALRNYSYAPYPGDVAFYYGLDSQMWLGSYGMHGLFLRLFREWGWQGLLQGNVEVHHVPCFGPVYLTPQVELLASQLINTMDCWEA